METWDSRRWGDIASIEYGKSLRDYDGATTGYRVFGTNGPIGWTDTPLCKHPGVVIGRKGAYRGVHYSSAPFFVIDTAFYLEPKQPMDLRWAYYELLTHDINSMDSGSAIPSTSREDFYALPVLVPPIEEQRAVASILGALDDKIELNRRMNETLEAAVRALFRSWFVDFDPVRAKAGGEQPWGMDADTAALFPDAFEDSDIGEIPQEWRVGSIGDIAENRREGANPDDLDRDTPYIGLEHMPRGSIALDEWETVEKVGSTKLTFEMGDILFGKLRPYFKKVGVALVDGVCSSDIVVVRPKTPNWFSLLLMQLSTQEFIDYTDSMSSGTKMPRVNWQDIGRYSLALPNEDVARAFDALARPCVERIRSNVMESRTLAGLRDTLLPKLLSGEVRVGDVGKIAEAAR